jgi:P4 family phage/plasmid primase-like protien
MTPIFQNNWNLQKDIFTRSIYKTNHKYNERPSLLKMQSFILNKQGVKLPNKKGLIYKHEHVLLEKYIELYNKKDDCFKVKYNLSKHKWGRINAVDGLTLSIFHRPTRHALSMDEYIDIDLVNAQPYTLNQICKQNNYHVPELDAYCENREKCLEIVMAHHNVSRDIAKKLFISLIFGGSYKSWTADYCQPEDATHTLLEWVNDFITEQSKLQEIVYKNNLQIIKDVEKEDPDKFKTYTKLLPDGITYEKKTLLPDGILKAKKRTCMALWAQTIERFMQEMVINYLVVNKSFDIHNIIPCQDGFMILKDLYYDGILEECENVFSNRLGFIVPLITKEFDEAINIPLHPDAGLSIINFDEAKEHLSSDLFKLIQSPQDVGIAKYFASLHGNKYRCSSIKNNIWYEFKDHKWNECEQGYQIEKLLGNDFKEHLMAENAKLKIKNVCKNKICTIFAGICDDLGRIVQIRFIMNNLKVILYEENFANRLDTNGNILCCSNGIFDFNKGLLRDGTPDDMCSISTNIPYLEYNEIDHEAKEKCIEFMHQIFPFEEQRTYMENHLASLLLGNPKINQTFTNYVGVGANGKSTLVTLMASSIGDYFGRIPASLVTQKRQTVGSASPEIAQLRGCRMAVIQEPQKGDKINEGIMKELTGEDKMQGRQLFRDTVTFLVMFGLVVCTNVLMDINSNDDGTWRRIRVVEFPSIFSDNPDEFNPLQFKKEPHLDINKMSVPFLAFLIELAMKTKGRVAECKLVTSAGEKYRKNQNKIGQFIADCIIEDINRSVTKISLSSKCSEWFEMNYKYRINNKNLFEILDKDYECINGSYYGIKIIDDDVDSSIVKTKEETFLAMFEEHFDVTNDSSHLLRSTRICEWAKTLGLKVDSSKAINILLLNSYNLDAKKKEQYKKIKVSNGSFQFWIGIKEKKEEKEG